MKKRAMKKWIPKNTCYCYEYKNGKYNKCKWLKYCGTIKRNKTNCEHSDTCKEECWTTPDNSCYNLIYRCEYLKYTDFTQESLLWDEIKECGVHDE